MGTPFKPPPFMKQQSRQLMMSLKKGRDEIDVDELGDLDITTILGSEIDDQPISQEDQDRVKEALKKGLDLREYSHSVESELNQLDKLTVADYFNEREDFLILYNQISVVDGVLQSVEQMLNHFYNDIKNIGSEMNQLQEKSMMMNYKVNNRKLLKEKLMEFIDVITIDINFSNQLTKGEINTEYVNCLQKLDQKITLFDDYKVLAPSICTYSQYIATEVINTYVENSERYYSNYYRNYTNSLLRMQDDATIKSDVGTKLKTIFSSATNGGNNETGRHHSIDLATLLHSMAPAVVNNGSVAAKDKDSGNGLVRTDQLKKEILDSSAIESPASASFWDAVPVIIPTSSNTPTIKYPFEQVYRSLVFFLMDIMTTETEFINKFFLGGQDMISIIFTRSISLLIETTEGFLTNSNDLVCISIVVGILNYFKYVMVQERNITVLNELLFDKLLPVATDRYLRVFSKHITLMNGVLMKDLKPINFLHSHFIGKRYAEFYMCLTGLNGLMNRLQSQLQEQMSAIEKQHNERQEEHQKLQQLMKEKKNQTAANVEQLESLDDQIDTLEATHLKKKQHLQQLNGNRESVQKTLTQLRDYSLQLLRKLSNEIASKPEQVIFMINNYSTILSVWRDSRLSGDDQSLGQLYALFQSATAKYIDDQLLALKHFSGMISFVNEWAPLVESSVKIDPAMNPSFNSTAVEHIFEQFENNWKSAVAVIKDNSIKHFASSSLAKNRTFDVLLQQLHYLYRGMTIVVQHCFPNLKNSKYFRPTQFLQDIRAMSPGSKFDDLI
ncbi:Vps52 / Sac2 family protein [Heterostelium album PN500]|uniref:Vps52 / Sac2 family protein n=1 Tax=Heterostelium pallidum (strain ATCC 26659 / Pp 5 / PN500) TaxID=670386 RepID=D3B822_HETP5|nr:Vps52 / Sac2 family protein [Heterostelium album PN500]EFA82190.1 Vps52 / Sac2 family protein [Heterostelium album PN500]|eukprot:XP_020434307.1 Vps52 / Sac2 family protein [Heterostelium album PN500]